VASDGFRRQCTLAARTLPRTDRPVGAVNLRAHGYHGEFGYTMKWRDKPTHVGDTSRRDCFDGKLNERVGYVILKRLL
jgi:hypothetical protein